MKPFLEQIGPPKLQTDPIGSSSWQTKIIWGPGLSIPILHRLKQSWEGWAKSTNQLMMQSSSPQEGPVGIGCWRLSKANAFETCRSWASVLGTQQLEVLGHSQPPRITPASRVFYQLIRFKEIISMSYFTAAFDEERVIPCLDGSFFIANIHLSSSKSAAQTLPKNRCTIWFGCLEERSFNFWKPWSKMWCFSQNTNLDQKETYSSYSFLFFAVKQQTNIWFSFFGAMTLWHQKLTRNTDRNRCWILRVSVRNQKI